MKIYTCGQRDKQASLGHPCGRAVKAVREAGYDPEIEAVAGYRMLPWTRRGGVRDHIREISGQEDVPVLVTDEGEVISGTKTIMAWAKEHPAR